MSSVCVQISNSNSNFHFDRNRCPVGTAPGDSHKVASAMLAATLPRWAACAGREVGGCTGKARTDVKRTDEMNCTIRPSRPRPFKTCKSCAAHGLHGRLRHVTRREVGHHSAPPSFRTRKAAPPLLTHRLQHNRSRCYRAAERQFPHSEERTKPDPHTNKVRSRHLRNVTCRSSRLCCSESGLRHCTACAAAEIATAHTTSKRSTYGGIGYCPQTYVLTDSKAPLKNQCISKSRIRHCEYYFCLICRYFSSKRPFLSAFADIK